MLLVVFLFDYSFEASWESSNCGRIFWRRHGCSIFLLIELHCLVCLEVASYLIVAGELMGTSYLDAAVCMDA